MIRFTAADANPLYFPLQPFKRCNITLVGCGGTGSHMISALASLALELITGQAVDVAITLLDPDIVEPKNVGRQLFAPADVGETKVSVCAARLALFDLPVTYVARPIDNADTFTIFDSLNLVIGCVDNYKARAMIHRQVKKARGALWWLDCGNDAVNGQALIGNTTGATTFNQSVGLGLIDRLPAPSLVYPDLVKYHKAPALSCDDFDPIGDQSLMVNRSIAALASTMLFYFLILRKVHYFGAAIDLQWGNSRPYLLDLATLAEVTGLNETDLQVKPE